MPESVENRFTTDFEYIFFFTKEPDYYFKLQLEDAGPVNRWGGAVNKYRNSQKKPPKQTQLIPDTKSPPTGGSNQKTTTRKKTVIYIHDQHLSPSSNLQDGGNLRPHGRNRQMRSVWEINPARFPGKHFAVFPEELVRRCIDAGCPAYICEHCHKPRDWIIERETTGTMPPIGGVGKREGYQNPTYSGNTELREIVGGHWSDCGCGAKFTPGIVFDPFLGSGTTMLQAFKMKRHAAGIELNPDYYQIARERTWQNNTKIDIPSIEKKEVLQ
jgi:hypothetical protein